MGLKNQRTLWLVPLLLSTCFSMYVSFVQWSINWWYPFLSALLQVTAFDNHMSSKFLLELDPTPSNIKVMVLLLLSCRYEEISTKKNKKANVVFVICFYRTSALGFWMVLLLRTSNHSPSLIMWASLSFSLSVKRMREFLIYI